MSGLLSATSPPLWESGQGFTCPECGKHITMHRHLRKTRIRWRLVGVCAVLALLAAASGLLP